MFLNWRAGKQFHANDGEERDGKQIGSYSDTNCHITDMITVRMLVSDREEFGPTCTEP